jgi:hypothetical protein
MSSGGDASVGGVVETVASHLVASALTTTMTVPCTDPRDTFVDVDLNDAAHSTELDAALAASTGVATDELTAETFPLGPLLAGRIAALREQVVDGPGLAILRLPPDWMARAGEETSARVFVGLCTHLGQMCEQSKDLLEKVARVEIPTDEAILASPNTARRGYRNQKPQRVHVDASIPAPRGEGETDILAMMCVRPALDGGGASKLTSAEALYAALSDQPQHLARLAAGFHYDAGVEWLPAWRQPQRSAAPVPLLWRDSKDQVCVQFGVNMRKNLEAAYLPRATPPADGGGGEKEDGGGHVAVAMDAAGVDALDALDAAANSNACLHTLQLDSGCALICDNYRWMHGRTEFSDDDPAGSSGADGDGDGGRLLIRLWLQTDDMRT